MILKKGGGGSLWVVTQAYGLLKLSVNNGKVSQVVAANDHLESPIENIQSIFVDDKETVWLATNNGVYSISLQWETAHYDQTNGLSNNDVNAVAVSSDTLWAATVTGLSKLLIKEQQGKNNFATLITGLRYSLGEQKVYTWKSAGTPAYTLPPNTTMLEVELSALYFRSRGNIRYEFSVREKLLPLSHLTFPNLFASLLGGTEKNMNDRPVHNFGANVTPGSYLVTATAILPGNVASKMPDSLTITVLPYWWQTIWLWLIGAILIFTMFWRLLKAREHYLKTLNANSELQLQAIRAQMNPHFVGNSINAIQQFFYPPDPVKASEYISIFSDLLRRTMYFSETDFISFGDELAYLDDYLKMIKLRFGNRFSYNIIGAAAIDETTLLPAMLLQPILENATIHGLSPSGPSKVEVEFYRKDERLFCTVTDNGVGIEASRARKLANPGNKRISKGISLLEKKVQTLNLLHPVELALEIMDLSKLEEGSHGTKATISFRLLKDFNMGYSSVEQISKMP